MHLLRAVLYKLTLARVPDVEQLRRGRSANEACR